MHGDDLLALEADPDVEALSIDAVISADRAVQSGDDSDAQLENVLVSALGLSDTAYNGDKVGIAVIDSGLEQSGDLSGGRADRFLRFHRRRQGRRTRTTTTATARTSRR